MSLPFWKRGNVPTSGMAEIGVQTGKGISKNAEVMIEAGKLSCGPSRRDG